MDNSGKQKLTFVVGAKVLNKKLKIANRVVSSGIVPILENFLFSVSQESQKLNVTTSDLETTINVSVEVSKVEGSGSICVPAKRLMELISVCGDNALVFKFTGTSLKINTGSGNYSVECFTAEEFPSYAEVEGECFSTNSKTLLSGILKTSFCAANDEYRPVMSGISVRLADKKIRFAATDTFKMSEYVGECDAVDASEFVIPIKAARSITGVFDGDHEVQVRFNDKNVSFQVEDSFVTCRRTEGKFPKYEPIINQELPVSCELDRAAFSETVKRVSVVAPKTSRIVTLKFSQTGLNISSKDIDFGVSGEETLSYMSSADCFISLNVDFLLEAISHLDGDIVTVKMRDERMACQLYTDNTYRIVLMPMITP